MTHPADETANAEKQIILNKLMATGAMVTICIDPRCSVGAGVAGLPPRHMQSTHVLLNLGYNLPCPTDDFVIAGTTLFVTLRFGGVPSALAIPLEAIFVVVCEAQDVAVHWPHSTPQGVRVVHDVPAAPTAPAPPPPRVEPAPKLVSLDSRRSATDLTACRARRAGGFAGGQGGVA